MSTRQADIYREFAAYAEAFAPILRRCVASTDTIDALLAAINKALAMIADAYELDDPYPEGRAEGCWIDGQRLPDLEEAVRVLAQAAEAAK